MIMVICLLVGIYASLFSNNTIIPSNNQEPPYSLTCFSNSHPTSNYPEHPTCPSDSEWVETENEGEGNIHIYMIRSESPVWQIKNKYSIQNNQVYSLFQPEYTPPPPRQIA